MTMIGCAPELDEPDVPRPLVVALHGYTQSARDYLATTEWDVLAGRYGFYVLFAQTPGNRSFDWFTAGRGRSGEDPMAIVAMVDRMKETYAIDDERVFVTGLSAGGYMTVSLLADYPDVFAAGATFSGGPHGCSTACMSSPPAGDASAVQSAYPTWWSDASRRRPRLMIVHGTTDGIVSFSNLDSTLRQWTGALGIDDVPDNDALGLPAELKEHGYSVYADGDRAMIETHTLEGVGHGTPVDPGDGVDEGGSDPSPAAFDWTIATTFYGAYYAARFFGIAE
jgi:poly(hydroxyalkanoate) depolymerase family esterase